MPITDCGGNYASNSPYKIAHIAKTLADRHTTTNRARTKTIEASMHKHIRNTVGPAIQHIAQFQGYNQFSSGVLQLPEVKVHYDALKIAQAAADKEPVVPV